MANKPDGCVKNQISVHNVVHPYRFTRDMLASMRVLRQLDDKFIVGVVSQEGKIQPRDPFLEGPEKFSGLESQNENLKPYVYRAVLFTQF